MSYRITSALRVGAFCLGFFLFAAPAQATFVNTLVDITLTEPDPPNADIVDQNLGVMVSATELEVFAGDGSAVGGVMFDPGPIPGINDDGEYIDIGADFIEFRLGGGGSPAAAGGLTTGFGAGSNYQLDFVPGVLALFEAPTLSLNGVSGVSLGTELVLTASSLMLFVDTLGVETPINFGTVRLDFELKDITPNPIPVPAALPLMLSALAVIGFLTRRRKPV